jgi:hypothetical protein
MTWKKCPNCNPRQTHFHIRIYITARWLTSSSPLSDFLRSFWHRVYGALEDPRTSKFVVIIVPKRGKQSTICVGERWVNRRKFNERLVNDTSCGKWLERYQITKTLSRENRAKKKLNSLTPPRWYTHTFYVGHLWMTAEKYTPLNNGWVTACRADIPELRPC